MDALTSNPGALITSVIVLLIGWPSLALTIMLLIDVTTNRITRFIGNKPWRGYLFLLLWPLLALYVFLPRYRVRPGRRTLVKPMPFVHS